MFYAGKMVRARAGKASSYASIGEAGEEAFPAEADSRNEQGIAVSLRVESRVNNLLKA
jgi:hypothetical protein